MSRSLPLSLPGLNTVRTPQTLLQTVIESARSNYSREDVRRDDIAYWPVPLPAPDPLDVSDPLVLFLSEQAGVERRSVIPMSMHEILERRSREQLKPSMQIPLGLIDKPEMLQCNPLLIDLHAAPGGPLLLVGAAHSGKATAIQTLLFWLVTRFLPEQFRCAIIDPLHELDFFQELPHLRASDGTLMWTDGSSDEKLNQFISTFDNEFLRRSEAYPYQRWNEGTLTQMWAQGLEIPQLLLIVSNYQVFSERSGAANALKKLALLAAEMRHMGIYLLVSSTEIDARYLPGELLNMFASKIGLQLTEQQRSALVGPTALVTEQVPGRGFMLSSDHDLHQIQIALPLPGITEHQRYETLKMELQWISRY
jgi:DNA segregation ATPase FtsK/SpoIIIE-like protein